MSESVNEKFNPDKFLRELMSESAKAEKIEYISSLIAFCVERGEKETLERLRALAEAYPGLVETIDTELSNSIKDYKEKFINSLDQKTKKKSPRIKYEMLQRIYEDLSDLFQKKTKSRS